MAESRVTVDGTTYGLKPPFLVIGTQNPIDHEGTFPLPEAQLDRFLYKLLVQGPSSGELKEILTRTTGGFSAKVMPVLPPEDTARMVLRMRELTVCRPRLVDRG